MPPWHVRQILFFLVTLLSLLLLVDSQQFDVLKIKDIKFPSSKPYVAHARTTYQGDISEYTLCYRHLIESYNDGLYCPVNIGPWKYAQRIFPPGVGGVNGFTGSVLTVWRNIPGGGLGNISTPFAHWPSLPTDIDISKWYHICVSYSSILHHIHMYMDSLKVFSYTYQDPKEDPLPSNTFENISFGFNMRGLITDVQLYNSYMDEKKLPAQTQRCENKPGEIFSWEAKKLNITKVIQIYTLDPLFYCRLLFLFRNAEACK